MTIVQQIVPTREWTNDELRKNAACRPGPWDNEPDKAQWQFNPYIACIVKRNHYGAWCGYVGVTPGHPFYQMDYNSDVLSDIDVHGGLTYSAMCDGDEEAGICHVAKGVDGKEVEAWWFGFDCAHVFDAQPLFGLGMEEMIGPEFGSLLREGHYWTYEEVRMETERLAEQLAKVLPR